MIEIGRMCKKLNGKEKGQKAVIIDILDDNFVLIDGNVTRRKCNINHIKLLPEKLEINKKESSENVKEIFKSKGILKENQEKIKEKRPRKKGKKPKKVRPRKIKNVKNDKSKKSKKKTEEDIVEQAMKATDKEINSKK